MTAQAAVAAPLVFLFGEESFLMDREIRAIEAECGIGGPEDMNRQLSVAPEIKASSIVAAARTMPFLGTRRLILVRDADKWNADEWETLLAYAEKPNPSTCLVLTAASVDKRRTWWKGLQKTARVVECPHPADAKLPDWIKTLAAEAGLKLDEGVVRSLILRVGPDLQLLWREILKLQAYAGEDRRVRVEDVEELVGESRGTTVFVLCDALGEKRLGPALRALRRLLELGEPPVLLIHMMVRHFRILFKARELLDQGGRQPDAAARLGVPPFAVKRSMDQAARWAVPALEDAFVRFLRADVELKSGGGEEVLHRLVIELCAPKGR